MNPTQQSILNRVSKDKFLLVLDLPIVMRNNIITDVPNDLETLSFSVFGTLVPDILIPQIPVEYGGQVYNVSSYARPNHQPLTVNFVVDNGFINYSVLWKWLNILNTTDGSIYGGSSVANKGSMMPEYQTTFTVYALDEYNQKVAEWIYHNAFIIGLGGITYNNRDATWIESTTTMQYSKLDFNLITPSTIT